MKTIVSPVYWICCRNRDNLYFCSRRRRGPIAIDYVLSSSVSMDAAWYFYWQVRTTMFFVERNVNQRAADLYVLQWRYNQIMNCLMNTICHSLVCIVKPCKRVIYRLIRMQWSITKRVYGGFFWYNHAICRLHCLIHSVFFHCNLPLKKHQTVNKL